MHYRKVLFLVNYTTLPLDNIYDLEKIFWNKFLKWIYNKVMTIDDQIRMKKIQYGNNREAAKISALSSGSFKSINILQVRRETS